MYWCMPDLVLSSFPNHLLLVQEHSGLKKSNHFFVHDLLWKSCFSKTWLDVIAWCNSAGVTALKSNSISGLVNQRSDYEPHTGAKYIPPAIPRAGYSSWAEAWQKPVQWASWAWPSFSEISFPNHTVEREQLHHGCKTWMRREEAANCIIRHFWALWWWDMRGYSMTLHIHSPPSKLLLEDSDL